MCDILGAAAALSPIHIRAIAEELSEEHGRLPKGSEKHAPWGADLTMHAKPWVRKRANQEYWENLTPATGRPDSPGCSCPENWGVTAGSEELQQEF